LTIWGLSFHLLAQSAILVAISMLWHKSNINNGIVAVPDTPSASFDSTGFHGPRIWTSTLLWTTIPAWVMSLYSAFWSAMLDELKNCQSTIELRRSDKSRRVPPSFLPRWLCKVMGYHNQGGNLGKASARHTILLDYRQVIPVFDSFKAIRNRHFFLALCMAVKAALWGASGLSAAILTPATVPFGTPVQLVIKKAFDPDPYVGVGPNSFSSRSALDIVSSAMNNNGSLFPWTSTTHSFLAFEADGDFPPGSITGMTKAYSASLECDVYSIEALLRMKAVTFPAPVFNQTFVTFNFTDRDCPVYRMLSVSANMPLYFHTFSSTSCSAKVGYYRFGLFAGQYDESSPFLLDNFTFITCKPSFWTAEANVAVTTGTDIPGQIIDFSVGNPTQIFPLFASHWLNNQPLYFVTDPAVFTSMDEIGRLVYNYNARKYPDNPLDSNSLRDSLQFLFGAFYATFASRSIYKDSNSTEEFTGTLAQEQSRLFVVPSAASAVIIITGAALCTTICLAIWLHSKKDILTKHLDLIMGHAILVSDSADMETYITEVGRSVEGDYGASLDSVKHAEKNRSLRKWRCWVDDQGRLYVRPPEGSRPPSIAGFHSNPPDAVDIREDQNGAIELAQIGDTLQLIPQSTNHTHQAVRP
jgi:hypothetical protein